MNFPNRTPPFGATGPYTLRAPWTIDTDAVYRCEAIRSFTEVEEDGVNPFRAYYHPKNVSKAVFDQDRVNGINIITLMDSAGDVIYVPSSYILSYPNEITSPYSHIVLSVDLGPLPDWRDLTALRNYIEQVAIDVVGSSQVSVDLHRVPMEGFISRTQAQQMEAARALQSERLPSHLAGKVSAEKELQNARAKIDALQEVAKNLV